MKTKAEIRKTFFHIRFPTRQTLGTKQPILFVPGVNIMISKILSPKYLAKNRRSLLKLLLVFAKILSKH
jgi:hypothetical protein